MRHKNSILKIGDLIIYDRNNSKWYNQERNPINTIGIVISTGLPLEDSNLDMKILWPLKPSNFYSTKCMDLIKIDLNT